MKGFFYNFSGEFKRYINRFNLIAWFIILVLLLIQANSTTDLLKNSPNKTKVFQQFQKKYWEKFPNYLNYQVYGINFLYVMPSTGIIANDTAAMDDLSSKIDFFAKVQIFSNFKGKAIFSQGKGIRLVFSVIIKLLISLIVLWYGFETFKNMDYLKSLSSIWEHRKNFIYTIFSRFLLFSLTFLLVMGLVFLFVWIRGVTFSPGEFSVIAGFLLEAVSYLGLFFITGALIGLFGQTKIPIILLFLSWFFLAVANQWIIAPAVTPEYLNTLKEYQNELDKIDIFAKVEETAQKERGIYDDSKREEAKVVIEDFWNNWYLKKIAPLEKKLRDMIAKAIEKDRRLSKFFPGPFFDMTANEVSGHGYESYMLFYDYTREMQKKFVRFVIDRAYYNDPKVMVNFIKGDEDIFYGKGSLPPNFWSGIIIQWVYLLILMIACFFVYRARLYPRPKNPDAFENLELELKSGENTTVLDCTDDEKMRPQLVNTFFGKNQELPLTVTLDGKPLPLGKKPGIIFVPQPKQIPGELKGKHMVRFCKRVFKIQEQDIAQLEKEIGKETLNKHFAKMEKEEIYKLVLSLFFLVKYPIYLFHNFTEGISGQLSQELFSLVEEKLPAGSMIIDITVSERKWTNQKHWCAVHLKEGKYRLLDPK